MITQKELKEVVSYDELTGKFTYVKTITGYVIKGNIAGAKVPNSSGYMTMQVHRRMYQAHRLVWLYVHGEFPKGQIDHKDGDKTNNKLSNLRDVSRGVNLSNRVSKTSTKCVGVTLRNGTYYARLMVDGLRHELGSFKILKDAVKARKAAEVLYKRVNLRS